MSLTKGSKAIMTTEILSNELDLADAWSTSSTANPII